MKLSFDGKGINDKSREYAPRVATFVSDEFAKEFGPLFAAAPELLEAAKIVLEFIDPDNDRLPGTDRAFGYAERLRKAVAKAEGRKK